MKIFLLVLSTIWFVSCQETFLGRDPSGTPRENFESLWKTLDEKYSFFDYKKIDWNEVYNRYSPRIYNSMDDIQLFNVLFEMLSELRDSHVNLVAPFNVSRYELEFTRSPLNYDERIVNSYYLKNDYYITGPFKHQLLMEGTVGYVRYASFEDEVTPGAIDFVTSRFKNTKGIIFDVRSNGGGSISNMFTIASRFADTRREVYVSYLKNGPGHEDFTGPNDVFIEPSGVNFNQRVCILTNRGSYSATSFFVLAMRNFPNITIVGDTTGGGLGAPTGAELPNGWGYRFSCSKTLSTDGQNYEDGIPPDVEVNMTSTDIQKNKDNIIEKAISIIVLGQ
jgi:Periplasmic protease